MPVKPGLRGINAPLVAGTGQRSDLASTNSLIRHVRKEIGTRQPASNGGFCYYHL